MHRQNAGAARSGTRGGEHWITTILNEAYKVLRGEKTRATYDKELFERYTKNPESAEGSERPPCLVFLSLLQSATVALSRANGRVSPLHEPAIGVCCRGREQESQGNIENKEVRSKYRLYALAREGQASPNHGSISKGNAV